ncbi:hypothetical protein CEUSTIGMA_g1523.t1 [Chlamydomonas eustigma]|uniref:Uncharacterized protein n=1 Tax=Chlamydomonas eustigma TaxID=1157962 RepID=A0A250WTC2_9CHLO|nr:hypothetical protein CEUSTIGMA_g1523.t1 [Chlamydomonas eustigma]|eukprot:GAX74073.1 hypothetical protein CEUSTIGMA_g1523.t1 [Chlamydomonas eustigma]
MELLKDPSTLTSVKVHRVLQKSKAANLGTNQLYHVAIEVGTGASPQETATTVQALAQLYQENFLLLEDEQTQRPEITVKLMDSDKDVKCTLDNCYNVSEEEEAVKGEGGVALAMGDVDAAHVEGGEQNSGECSAGGTGPAVQEHASSAGEASHLHGHENDAAELEVAALLQKHPELLQRFYLAEQLMSFAHQAVNMGCRLIQLQHPSWGDAPCSSVQVPWNKHLMQVFSNPANDPA